MEDSIIQKLESRTPLTHAQRTIQASVGQVWPYIGAIGAEKLFIPGVLKSEFLLDGDKSLLPRRRIDIEAGTVYEQIVVYRPDRFQVAYVVEEEEGSPFSAAKGICGIVQLEALGPDSTRVTWRTFFEETTPEVEKVLREMSGPMWQGALENLANLAEK